MSSLKDPAPAVEEQTDSQSGAASESRSAERPKKEERRDKKHRKSSRPAIHETEPLPARKQIKRTRKEQSGDEPDRDAAKPVQTQLSREERKAARKAARRLQNRRDGSTQEPRRPKNRRRDGSSEEGSSKGRRRRNESSEDANETFADNKDVEESQDPLAGEASPEGRKSGRRRRERFAKPLSTIVRADDQNAAARLFANLQSEFAFAGVQLVTTNSDADLIVSLGPFGGIQSSERNQPITVFYAQQSSGELLRAAAEHNGIFLPTEPISTRVDPPSSNGGKNVLNDAALRAGATAIRDAVLISERGTLVTGERNSCASDYAKANSLADVTSELLKALNWGGKSVPGSIRPRADIQSIEGFLDGVIKFREGGKRDTLALSHDWSTAPESRGAIEAVYSLDFLAAALGYWFQKANRSSSKAIGQIDALVKQRDLTATAILARCTDVMLSFLDNARSLPEPAWQMKIAMRRARAMLLYLLCCRAAAQRRIKFDEQSLAPVFRAFLDLLERLRWASYCELGNASAVARAASIAGLALPLRQTQYGKNLLDQALQAVDQHLEVGLSSDGVWREGFAQHDAVFRSLKTISADLQAAEVPSLGVKARLMQMAQFESAFLRDDGYSPPLPGLVTKKYRFSRAAAQSLLRRRSTAAAAALVQDGLQDARFFPEARLFVSRSTASKGAATSHFVLQAAPSASGGPTLSFCVGASPLLVGGGTSDRKASQEIRRATQRDPGAHNALRVDGQIYRDVDEDARDSVQITGVWEEKSWAAARLVNRIFGEVVILRTAIHLKPLHALLVVDELSTGGEPLQFQQFWHLAPGAELRSQHPPEFHFALGNAKATGLAVTFDRSARIVLKKGGSGTIGWTSTEKRDVVANPYFIREIRTAKGLLASCFRCIGGNARHEVSAMQTDSGWKAVLLCAGRQIAFVREDEQLKLVA